MKDSFRNSIVRRVKRKLKDPNTKSLKRVATGIMGNTSNKRFKAIFRTSEVAFHDKILIKAYFP